MEINGRPVVDAKKKLRITITPGDVAMGDRKNASACAAARACMRQFNAVAALVWPGRIYIYKGQQWVRFHTPQKLRTEMGAFDRGRNFNPGDYILTPMQPSRLKGKRQGTAKGADRPKKLHTKRAKARMVSLRSHGAVNISRG